MRRVLTILSAIVLLLASLGIGVFTADLPFWRRALQLPLTGDSTYLPVAVLGQGSTAVAATAPLAVGAAMPLEPPFDQRAMEQSAARARDLGSRALLVMHRGRLVMERYFLADD